MKQTTHADFAQSIATGAVVIDFFAERCPPCKMLTPVLEDLQNRYAGKITIYKVDVDQEQMLARQQGITAMPTLQFFQDGQHIQTVLWFDPVRITAIVDAMAKDAQ